MERTCDLFLDHLRVERNLSPRTVAAYGGDLLELRRALAQAGVTCVAEVRPGHVTRWQHALAGRGLAASSQARAMSAARRFFAYALREGFIASNPLADVPGPKLGRRLPQVLAVEQANRLIEATEGHEPTALRDRAISELLYGSGLRASELCTLRLDDLGLSRGLVRVRGKGDKERVVPIGGASQRALVAYLDRGRAAFPGARQSPFVFVGRGRGGAMSRVTVFRVVRQAALRAGMSRAVSPHKLRHAFATHLLQGGADLRSVQELLGHAKVTTTEIYTHVAGPELRRTIDQHHPLGDGPTAASRVVAPSAPDAPGIPAATQPGRPEPQPQLPKRGPVSG